VKISPHIQAETVAVHGIVELKWDTGETFLFDLSDLAAPNSVFSKLSDPDFFSLMERDDWGHGIGWPVGLDLGAERPYALCRERADLQNARSTRRMEAAQRAVIDNRRRIAGDDPAHDCRLPNRQQTDSKSCRAGLQRLGGGPSGLIWSSPCRHTEFILIVRI